MQSLPRGFWLACVGVFFVGFGIRLVLDLAVDADGGRGSGSAAAAMVAMLEDQQRTTRSVAVYGGLGTWIDAFDIDPAYQPEGSEPPLDETVVDELAELGVRTVYLQAARLDDRTTGRLLDETVLAEFLVRAHARDIAVVGWYLPRFEDIDVDLDHLLAIAEFEVGGHRFDGVAVDIEYIEGVPDPDERSRRLVELSERLRAERPGEALGAIVPPPVQLEVVNPAYWPRFPWRALDASYDVWLPMAYWTVRDESSGYRDAYRYTEESTRRMRANIGREGVVVHQIGGIGDEVTSADLDDFRRAIEDTGAIGGSIYDWHSLDPERRAELARSVPD